MACALTQGFTLAGLCKDAIGGVSEALFMEFGNLTTVTTTAGKVTAITKASGKKYYRYELQRDTSSLEETITSTPENGTVSYKQELKIVLNRMQTATRNEILLLAANVLSVIVKDRNGVYWMIGLTKGADITTGKVGTGMKATDRNGYELTFTAEEPALAIEVDSTIISGLLA